MGTSVQDQADSAQQTTELRCMDIWGGSSAADHMFSVPGLDVHVVSVPHERSESGGDIYYISMCGVGNITRITVADVSGHGESVSKTAAKLRKLMRKYINTPDQARFTRSINDAFIEDSSTELFATAILATYWAPSDHLILVNAGHPPPLLFRRAQREWFVLDEHAPGIVQSASKELGLRNLPLGIIEPTGYDQIAIKLEQDDLVLMYTDAIPEATNEAGEQLGTRGLVGLCEKIQDCDTGDLAEYILNGVRAYRGGKDPEDDLTLIALHHNGADPKPVGIKGYTRMLGRMTGLIGPSVRA